MSVTQARYVADVWTSNVDKHSVDGEVPVRLCNYTDAYKSDTVEPHAGLMTATATPDELHRFRLKTGDTVLTKDSEDPGDIGISAFITDTAPDFVCGYHLAIARPREATHPRFLTWALRAQPALDHFSTHASGISRYGLGLGELRATPIPVHDFDRQRRIADFLDDRAARIDQIINARKQQVQHAREAHLEQARVLTTRGLDSATRPSGVDWMPTVGRRHELWRVGQAFDTGSGTTPRSDRTEFYGGDVPWVTTSDLRDTKSVTPLRTVSSEALTAYTALTVYPAGTLLVAMYGATVGRVGILAVDAAVNQACCALVPRAAIDPTYAFYWLLAHRTDIMRLASGGGQPNISQDIVRALRIPAPETPGQSQIASRLDAAAQGTREAIDACSRSIDLLTEYKQSLITAAVTGELDVTTAGSGIPG